MELSLMHVPSWTESFDDLMSADVVGPESGCLADSAGGLL
jgi:hypothetical protein